MDGDSQLLRRMQNGDGSGPETAHTGASGKNKKGIRTGEKSLAGIDRRIDTWKNHFILQPSAVR